MGIFFYTTRPISAQSGPGNAAFKALIAAELARHPQAQVVDIYKLMYQGAFGIGHLISSREDAAAYLRNEIDGILPAADEMLLTPCNTDSTQFRVHLRPFIAAGLDQEALVDAMMESVDPAPPDTAVFALLWRQAGVSIRVLAPDLFEQFDEFTRFVRLRGYPLVSHSDAYREAYAPAYRVLNKRALMKYFPQLLQTPAAK